MTEIKTEIKQNADGSYTITDAHSTADVVRWLLTQDSKEIVLYLLGDTPQRTWVGLTDERKKELWISTRAAVPRYEVYAHLVEKELKELNTQGKE